MFNNIFSNESIPPKGSLEITLRVRARERQQVLQSLENLAEKSSSVNQPTNAHKSVLANLFASIKAPRRQLATANRK